MVVTQTDVADTIGGGALEQEAIEHARSLLGGEASEASISQKTFTLGNDLTQCCGGRVTLLFDCQWSNTFTLYIFGAGHVAQEMVKIVSRLPCRVYFLDDRLEWRQRIDAQISQQGITPQSSIVTDEIGNNPYAKVEGCSADAYYLIMTHSHELDFELVEAVLSRADARYCGLIASRSKAASFRSRLARKGFSDSELSRLTAPLGQWVQTGNLPMEVAIAGVSDILTIRQKCLLQ